MSRCVTICILSGMLLAVAAVRAEPLKEPSGEMVQQLESEDGQVRAEAEKRLIGLGARAVDALVRASCRNPAPSPSVADATLRILGYWEEASWADANSAAAIDEFVRLARDPQNSFEKHRPLSPNARYPFAEKVRVLDIWPDEAAAYLRVQKGVTVSKDQYGFYRTVSLNSDWIGEPKDWLYIANLACEIKGTPSVNGKRHPISIDISGSVEGDTLAECFRFFRKSRSSPFDLFLWEAPLNREALLVLGAYPEFTGLLANNIGEDIKDDDWAACISGWPHAIDLTLSPTAGRKAIAAVSQSKQLRLLKFRNATLTATDLEPLRKNEALELLWAWDGKAYIQYVNQDGTGRWQLEEARRNE